MRIPVPSTSGTSTSVTSAAGTSTSVTSAAGTDTAGADGRSARRRRRVRTEPAAALFGLGSGVNIRRLFRTGGRAALLGLCSWVLVAGIAYAGVRLVGG